MLLDTSGLVSFFDDSDARHVEAVTHFQSGDDRLTHSYVLAEFVAVCQSRRLNRLAALSFLSELLDNPAVEVVWVDEVLHRAGVSLLQARLDKSYSLCDAVSFLLMRHRSILEGLSTDHHFEQEGFVRLLKP